MWEQFEEWKSKRMLQYFNPILNHTKVSARNTLKWKGNFKSMSLSKTYCSAHTELCSSWYQSRSICSPASPKRWLLTSLGLEQWPEIQSRVSRWLALCCTFWTYSRTRLSLGADWWDHCLNSCLELYCPRGGTADCRERLGSSSPMSCPPLSESMAESCSDLDAQLSMGQEL